MDMEIGDIVRYSGARWGKPAAGATGYRKSDIRYRTTIIGRVERMTDATVWVRSMDGSKLTRTRMSSMRGFENRSRMADERPGHYVDQTTGEIQMTARRAAEAEIDRWLETVRVYGEYEARRIATVHLGSAGIIDRILTGAARTGGGK